MIIRRNNSTSHGATHVIFILIYGAFKMRPTTTNTWIKRVKLNRIIENQKKIFINECATNPIIRFIQCEWINDNGNGLDRKWLLLLVLLVLLCIWYLLYSIIYKIEGNPAKLCIQSEWHHRRPLSSVSVPMREKKCWRNMQGAIGTSLLSAVLSSICA